MAQSTDSADTAWTPVALSHALFRGEVRPAFTPALSIALWRDSQGTAHATHTRCPHRGMNLAYGFVRDQNLACAYHGWQYDAAGQCVYIPAHPELPPARSICATVHACVEVGGVIFVRDAVNDDDTSNKAPVEPTKPQVGVRTVIINCRADVIYDSLGADTSDRWVKPKRTDNIVCAIQALPDSRTAIHVLIDDANANVASKLAAARWACRLRDACEAQAEREA